MEWGVYTDTVNVRAFLLLPLLALGLCSCQLKANAAPPSPATAPASPVQPSPRPPNTIHPSSVRVSQLPPEGQRVYRLIDHGGPFRYAKDGSTFGNREGRLPRQSRGYYREYTVRTPGESDRGRGARRIICGGQPATSVTDCYYTADHYASFRKIVP